MTTHPPFMTAALEAARAALPTDKLGDMDEVADELLIELYQVRLTSGHFLCVELDINRLTVYEPGGRNILFRHGFNINITLT